MPSLHCLQRHEPARPEGLGSLDQPLVADDVEHRQTRSRADRALLMRVMAEGRLRHAIEPRVGHDRRHGHDAAAEPLAENQDVRDGAGLFAREHRAGPREAARDLVEDQERAVTRAAVAYPRPEARRRRLDGGPAHRLGHQRRDIALHGQRIVDEVGEALEGPVLAEETRREMQRRQMFAARHHRPEIAPEQGLPADPDRVEVGAVEGIPHRQRLVPARRVARELQRHADGGGPARREQHFGKVARCRLAEPFGQRDGGAVGVAARAEGQTVDLGLDGRDDARVAVAELVDAVAVEIEDAAPLDIDERGALGPLDDIETRRRQGLVQEVALVGVEKVARLGAELCPPSGAQRRKITVALADGRVVERRPGRHHGRSPRSSRPSIAATTGMRSATLSIT